MSAGAALTAWELRSGRTDALTRCILEEESDGVVVRITHGEHDIVSYWCTTRQDAVTRATAIHDGLSRRGWIIAGG